MATKIAELTNQEKVAAAAGVALGIGAFLPWITGTAPFVGTISRSGMSDSFSDGWMAIALGVAIVLAVLNRKPSLTLLAGIGALIFVGVEYSDVSSRISEVRASTDLVSASVGNGIWLMAAASIAVVVAAFSIRGDAEAEPFAAQHLPSPDADDSELIDR